MICHKEKCTGCFGCYNICPKNAIEMIEDDNGFIYPKINQEKCINCKLCEKVCPSINLVEKKYPVDCYAMFVNDENKRRESTSGGAASVFYEYILKNNGIVYGATVNNNFNINFIRIDNIKDLYKVKGSKYVHCYINDIFKNVKKDLCDGLKVLFIGTPCQIAGLKRFLLKNYDNLYTIDIICHGVPSQRYLKDEINDLNIDKLTFREKNGFVLKAYYKEKLKYKSESSDSQYYSMFLKGLNYRENCYTCIYAEPNRVSDMTIGDFWGLGQDSKLFDSENNGVSVLLPITQKGLELIEACKINMILEKRDVLEAIRGNSQLNSPVLKPSKYEKFKQNYIKYGFKLAYKKSYKSEYIKNVIKRNKVIHNFYMKLKEKK